MTSTAPLTISPSPPCSAETTCEAMEDIKDYMNVEVFPDEERETCALSADCLLVSCSSPNDDAHLNFTLIPCSSPPGITIGFQGPGLDYFHLFNHSEVSSVFISGVELAQFNVTLDQMKNAIGVKARLHLI